jgi:CheY-like chemotaxis protein
MSVHRFLKWHGGSYKRGQTLAARMLEKQGHTVVMVEDGRAALEALAQDAFDLVLIDMQRPHSQPQPKHQSISALPWRPSKVRRTD